MTQNSGHRNTAKADPGRGECIRINRWLCNRRKSFRIIKTLEGKKPYHEQVKILSGD